VNNNNNNNNSKSCNKSKAFAERGIRRYHAITAQVQVTGGSRLGVNVDYSRMATDTTEHPDRPV